MQNVELANGRLSLTVKFGGVLLSGPKGDPGVGVPPGGAAGQVLMKESGEDYDTGWRTLTGGGGATTVVDSALSLTSANPVENKVITAALANKASTATATQSAAGLMSAADKAKLDGIERGANKTTVPTALKNPNALTIKIGDTTVTYDGSVAKTVTIADGSEVAY